MTNYKIITPNIAHKRWIKLGLLTQDISILKNLNESNQIITTDIKSRQQNQSLVLLDSMTIQGVFFKEFDFVLKNNFFEKIFLVGNSAFLSDYLKANDNIRLLFNQELADNNKLYKRLHSISIFERFNSGIYPQFFYSCRDLIKHYREVFRLQKPNKLMLYAGQDGYQSLLNVFNLYNVDNRIKKEIDFITQEYVNRITKHSTITEISDYIIQLLEILVLKLESLPLAKEQYFFKDQRYSLLFKSIFRFILIQFLIKKEYLTLIKYPEKYLRIYNSQLYIKWVLIDFGGINGFEMLYPRTVDMIYNRLMYYQFDQNEMFNCQNNMNLLVNYIETELEEIQHSYNLLIK